MPLFVFACAVFGFHAIMIGILIAKRLRNGNTSNKYFPLIRFLLLVGELVCLSIWLLMMIDAL